MKKLSKETNLKIEQLFNAFRSYRLALGASNGTYNQESRLLNKGIKVFKALSLKDKDFEDILVFKEIPKSFKKFKEGKDYIKKAKVNLVDIGLNFYLAAGVAKEKKDQELLMDLALLVGEAKSYQELFVSIILNGGERTPIEDRVIVK
jgi:hypothetical protein